MSFKYNQLVLPFALWSGSPPEHSITCMTCVRSDIIATGSDSGLVCIWRVLNDRLVPLHVLVGHSDSISCIITETIYHVPCLISISKDGTICLWDYVDGMCLKSADKLLNDYQPISATPVGDGKHIAVSGRSNHVVIVDVSKMKTLSTFANHSNWCISVFPCRIQLSETEHVFLSLCNGVVRFWTLSDDFTLTAVQTIVPDVENLKSISMCPKNTTFVAICPKSWSLFAATNSHLLETVDCPFDDEWMDGIYLDSYHVMVWTMNGRACLYRIPDISKYHPMDFGSGAEYVPSSPSPNSTSSVLLRKFSIIGDIDLDDVESGNRSVISCCSNDGKLFCVASKDNDGKISLFKVPDEALGDETIEKKEEQPEIAPTIWGSIKEYWEDYSFENISSPVTASCISPELLLSITGHLDGSITIKKLPYDDSPKIYSNCHVGKVTALMVTRITKNNTYVLLTGGEDCRIYGWDLETGECVRTLTQHCGTILQLLPFPLPPVNGDKEHFLSVSSDGSIGIFSADSLGIKPTGMFGGHKSPIISVQLRTDQDYMFVNCEDDSVTIWEISTGSFEGCYPAGSLTDVKSMTMTRVPLKSRNNPNDIQKDSQSTITLYSSKVSPPIPSASVLFLNIRYLIEHKTNSKNDILQYLGLLLPWNLSEKIDSLANSIGIPFHSENFSVGTYGINGKYSLFLPNRNLSNARFSCSRQVTALQTLAVVSLITKLESLVDEESQKEVSQLKELFISNLHEFVENYQPACLGLLSNYYQDKILVIENAAHSIFLSTLKHQNEKQRAMFLQNWINRMAESDRHALKSKAIPGLLLGIVISEHSDIQLENNLYENISKSLTNLVMNYPELSVQLLAANILAKGYSVWGPFIQDTGILFEKLLSIQTPSYPGKLSQSENSVYNLVTQVPELFISTLNTLSKSKTFGSNDYLMALRVIEKLISEIPFSILDDVITVVEIVIRALNPKHRFRAKCSSIGTDLILKLVATYPMVSYDKDSQRLIVGCNQKYIAIIDLKEYKIIHKLSTNTPVLATAISNDTKYLASFSLVEKCVYIWSLGSSSFLFSSNPKLLQGIHTTMNFDNNSSLNELVAGLKLEWQTSQSIRLRQPYGVVDLQL